MLGLGDGGDIKTLYYINIQSNDERENKRADYVANVRSRGVEGSWFEQCDEGEH